MDFNFITQKFAKNEKCKFQTLEKFFFDLKVASKPFLKKLSRTNFAFKKFGRLCLTFPENSFNFFI